jgi:carboxyl-terminal processing protease
MRLKPKSGRAFAKSLLNIFILLAIFMVGVNVGNGRIDFHRHNQSNKQLPAKLNYDSVDQVYKSLKENYDGKLTQSQLEDGLKHGLAEATNDPYTVYFTASEAAKFESEVNNHFSGVGAQLGKDADGNLQVIAPIAGFPAEKAGLKPKDIIVKINGQDTTGMSIDEAVSKIKGPSGTKVKLEIVRNKTQPLEFTIQREEIKVPSVTTKILDNNIGYIQISDFANDTAELTAKAAQDMKSKGVKGLIIDLRNNGGGYLDAAVNVSSLWLPKGSKVLDQRQGNNIIDTQRASGGDTLGGIPTVVLINDGSASASEITAGALHDNKAAYLIGEKSYGKGVVQQLINFRDGSQLKVTVASWYRPNGQNINHKGITPDKVVKISDADAKAGTDTQLLAAQAYLKTKQ